MEKLPWMFNLLIAVFEPTILLDGNSRNACHGYYEYLLNHEGNLKALSLGRSTDGDSHPVH